MIDPNTGEANLHYNCTMQFEVSQKLIDLNRQFYQTFGKAFAATRQRIQPGIARLLEMLPKGGDWLDLGCGSGAVAAAWAKSPEREGRYTGLDFSPVLLEEARNVMEQAVGRKLQVDFIQADITAAQWSQAVQGKKFDLILAFAVLHHIPGMDLQQRLLKEVYTLLNPGGLFIHSVWQFQHSPRLMARRQPWNAIGLHQDQVDKGDHLLDWRYALPGQQEQVGLRYVHLFDRQELEILTEKSGFAIQDTFESDGRGGRLGLYQIWQKE